MARRKRLLGLVFGGGLLICALSPAHAVTAEKASQQIVRMQDLAQNDITVTGQGASLAASTAARFQHYGIQQKPLKVYQLAPGEYLVAPANANNLSLQTYKRPDGEVQHTIAVTTPSNHTGLTQASGAIQSGGWTQVAGECFARTTGDGAYMDTCYKLNQYSDPVWNGGAYKDVYALHYWGVANSDWGHRLTQSWISSTMATGSSSMAWADWQPRADTSGNCRNFSLGFSVSGISVSHSGTFCEKWSVGKWPEPGEMASTWIQGGRGTTESRENAAGVEVYVPRNGWPMWNLRWKFWWN